MDGGILAYKCMTAPNSGTSVLIGIFDLMVKHGYRLRSEKSTYQYGYWFTKTLMNFEPNLESR